ncbi:hypothetical protein KCU89_g65, partial [Aureobasidium melanogenum]
MKLHIAPCYWKRLSRHIPFSRELAYVMSSTYHQLTTGDKQGSVSSCTLRTAPQTRGVHDALVFLAPFTTHLLFHRTVTQSSLTLSWNTKERLVGVSAGPAVKALGNPGITDASVRRLARRGGVKRISATVYDETRGVVKTFLESVIRDAVVYTEHAQRKTVTSLDIVHALKRRGRECPLWFWEALLQKLPGGCKASVEQSWPVLERRTQDNFVLIERFAAALKGWFSNGPSVDIFGEMPCVNRDSKCKNIHSAFTIYKVPSRLTIQGPRQ